MSIGSLKSPNNKPGIAFDKKEEVSLVITCLREALKKPEVTPEIYTEIENLIEEFSKTRSMFKEKKW